MARTPRADRASVADVTLTLRLTQAEKNGLQRVVDAKRAELEAEFPGAQLTMATFVRGLIARELRGDQPAGVSTEDARARIIAAVKAESPKYRRLVPIPVVRKLAKLPREQFDHELLELEALRAVDLKIANDPESPIVTEHGGQNEGIRVADRGLVWFAVLP